MHSDYYWLRYWNSLRSYWSEITFEFRTNHLNSTLLAQDQYAYIFKSIHLGTFNQFRLRSILDLVHVVPLSGLDPTLHMKSVSITIAHVMVEEGLLYSGFGAIFS